MRLWFLICSCVIRLSASVAVPSDVQQALQAFRPEGPVGWSFTQTTAAEGREMVERYDASQPVFRRWTLVSQDGQPPSPIEAETYRQKFTRQSSGGSAPHLNQQIDPATVEKMEDHGEETTFTARFKTAEDGDRTSAFLRIRFTWHEKTRAITSFTIESLAPFSPSLGVKIAEMRTTMTYTEPTPDRPSLLLNVKTRLRGTAFWFKTLDADMTVIYTDYKSIAAARTPLK